MSVDIPVEFTPFIESLIESGQFQNESAVVAHALRLLKSVQSAEAELHRDVLDGFAQLERGESLPAEEVFDRLRERLKKSDSGEHN